MTVIDLIRVILLFAVFRMIWKCFHKFPQEYFHETSYFLLYTFSYLCFIISFLVLLFITKISVILHIVESDVRSIGNWYFGSNQKKGNLRL